MESKTISSPQTSSTGASTPDKPFPKLAAPTQATEVQPETDTPQPTSTNSPETVAQPSSGEQTQAQEEEMLNTLVDEASNVTDDSSTTESTSTNQPGTSSTVAASDADDPSTSTSALKTTIDGKASSERTAQEDAKLDKALDEATTDLKKSSVKVVESEKPISVTTETGANVVSSLGKNEASKVVEAADGSSVLLVNEGASSKQKVAVTEDFVADKIEDAVEATGIQIDRRFRRKFRKFTRRVVRRYIRFVFVPQTVFDHHIQNIGRDTADILNRQIIRQSRDEFEPS